MKVIRYFKQKDFLVALFVLVLSSAVGAYSYALLLEKDQKSRLFAGTINTGASEYLVKAGGRCAGIFSTVLDDSNGIFALDYKGELRTRVGDRVSELHLKGEAAFNALGQLSAALFNLSGPEYNAGVGLLEIDPIKVKVWAKPEAESIGKGFQHEFLAPGPVELKRAGLGAFRLTYIPLASATAYSRPFEGLKKLLQYEVIPTEDNEKDCAALGNGEIDLSTIVATSQSGASFLGPVLDRALRGGFAP